MAQPEEALAPSADYSLRSSGRTYIERDREAEKILGRIERSSASVIGISGVRGAGKSSLAKKVLQECDGQGFFTLLIPSPTGYESREFLLAIFQRIAEHAAERIRQAIDGLEDLAAVGETNARRIRRLSIMIVCAAALLVCLVTGGGYFWLHSQLQQAHEANVTLLRTKLSMVDIMLAKTSPMSGTPAPADRSQTAEKDLRAQVEDVISQPTQDLFATRLGRLDNAALPYLKERLASLIEQQTSNNIPLPTLPYLVVSLLGAVGFLLTAGAAHASKKLNLRYAKYRRFSKQVGLRAKCDEFLQLIKYQTVLSSGSELSLPLKYLTGKLTASKQLTDRPLSLPGLTAICSEFLQQVAEVFDGKAVICIDELDKITDVTQLLDLLKGIKGILGQENTHFMLTISEDAMTFFTERLNRERNLVESSFEDIVYLDRLSYDLSRRVIGQSLGLRAGIENSSANSVVLWVFGAGIPREIKRNINTCNDARIEISSAQPLDTWRILFVTKLKSMLLLSAPGKASEAHEHYKFLVCVEQIQRTIDEMTSPPDARAFADSVLATIRQHFHPVFASLAAPPDRPAKAKSRQQVRAEDNDGPDQNLYLAQLMEAIIGAILLTVLAPAANRAFTDYERLDALIYVYKFIPINPQYAFYALDQFLKTRLRDIEFSLDALSPATSRAQLTRPATQPAPA